MKGVILKIFLLVSLFQIPSLSAEIAVTLPSNSARTSTFGDVSSFGTWGFFGSGFRISWNITNTGANYNYIYSFSNVFGGNLNKGLDTFILQLNPSITPSNLSSVITNLSSNVESSLGPQTFTPGDANSSQYPFLPGSIYGILMSFDGPGTTTLSFTSTNAPVWGSFYADNGHTGGGSRGYAYNASYGINATSMSDLTNYIPTVGGPSVLAPEPSTLLVLGSSLVIIAYLKRRKTNIQI